MSIDNDSLSVVYRPIQQLRRLARNPRTHTQKQVRQIADSIQAFGFTNPILLDADDQILAGHGRLEAAKLLSLKQVPTIRLAELSPAQRRAYVLADNRLAEKAGWDPEILAAEFEALLELDLDFDLTITGFETAEIDLAVGDLVSASTPADDIPAIDDSQPIVAQPGDLWALGPHRLFCGDACDPASYGDLLKGELAQVIFTDPPYNVPIAGHVSGLGKTQHQEFSMACGELSPAEFTEFLQRVLTRLATHSADGAIHFVCMDWRHLEELLQAGQAVYSELKNLCVWNKTNGGMGSLYRSQHELVLVFKHGTAPHINNVELGRHGRYRTNVWTYPGSNTLGAERDAALAMHPTVKPVALVADAIRDCSTHGGLVLDAFGGSGTTLIAAEQTGRRAALLELDPVYVDVTLRRFHELTGTEPRHLSSGQRFSARLALAGSGNALAGEEDRDVE